MSGTVWDTLRVIMVMGYFLRQMIYLFLSCIDYLRFIYIYIYIYIYNFGWVSDTDVDVSNTEVQVSNTDVQVFIPWRKTARCGTKHPSVFETSTSVKQDIQSGTVWDTFRVIMVMGYFLRQMIYLFLSCIDYLRFWKVGRHSRHQRYEWAKHNHLFMIKWY